MMIFTDGAGGVLQFPYDDEKLRAKLEADGVAGLPRTFDKEFAAQYGVFDVSMPEKPQPSAGKVVVPDTPVHTPGTWVQPTTSVLDEDGNDTGTTRPLLGEMREVEVGEDEDGQPIIKRRFVEFDPPTVAERYGTWSADWIERDKTAEELEAERAEHVIDRGPFAVRAASSGIITAAEAIAWAGGTALPAVVGGIMEKAIPDAGMLLAAKVEALTVAKIRRDNPLIAMLQSGLGLSDAQVDALFA